MPTGQDVNEIKKKNKKTKKTNKKNNIHTNAVSGDSCLISLFLPNRVTF